MKDPADGNISNLIEEQAEELTGNIDKKLIKGLQDFEDLAHVGPEQLWSDGGIPFPRVLLVKFKKFTDTCELIQEMGREWHKGIEYLMSWGRLNAVKISSFEECGTLSHLLILHLSLFEEEMRASNKRLPKWEPRKKPDLKETEAERQIAFCQEQRRKKIKAGDERTLAEKMENKDNRPESRARAGSESVKSQHSHDSPKISVSRSIKRSRSYREQRKRGPKISAESKRRRLTEPRSRSRTNRKKGRITEERKLRSTQRRRTMPRTNSGRDRRARQSERHRYPRRTSRDRRSYTRPKRPYTSPEYSLARERGRSRHKEPHRG